MRTMAKRNFLVEGLSGTGKSSVYEELIRRGHTAITTDRLSKGPRSGGVMHSGGSVTDLEEVHDARDRSGDTRT